MEPLACPVCGDRYIGDSVRDEPVVHAGHAHGWAQTIKTYTHADGREHRVPIGVAWERPR